MDITGSLKNLAHKPFQREFMRWVLQWFYTDFIEESTMKPDAPDLACLLQAVGFQLRGFEKKEDVTTEKTLENGSLRVVIECGSSKMRAVMELDGVNCHCPNVDDAKDASFWSVSGTGPMGSMDNINKVEETGSNLLPSVSKEATNVIRDIIYRLFKMVQNAPDVHQNANGELDLTALENVLKISPKPGSSPLTRSVTQPDIHQGRYRSLDTLTGSCQIEGIKGLPKPGKLNSLRTKSSSLELAKLQERPKQQSLKRVKDTVDSNSSCPRASTPSESNPPPLRREKTWNLEADIASVERDPSLSNVSRSPSAMPQLCTSMEQVSLQSEEKNAALADTLLEAKFYLERALKMLSKNVPNWEEQEVFLKPAPPRNSSFKISPGSTSRSSSSCSLPNRATTKNSTLQNPTARRSVGNVYHKSPVDKRPSPTTKTLVRRKSIGTPTHASKLSLPKADTPRPGSSASETKSSTSLTSRIFVAAKRRVSDPKTSPMQTSRSSLSLSNSTSTTTPGLQKPVPTPGTVRTVSESGVSKFGFARKKL